MGFFTILFLSNVWQQYYIFGTVYEVELEFIESWKDDKEWKRKKNNSNWVLLHYSWLYEQRLHTEKNCIAYIYFRCFTDDFKNYFQLKLHMKHDTNNIIHTDYIF